MVQTKHTLRTKGVQLGRIADSFGVSTCCCVLGPSECRAIRLAAALRILRMSCFHWHEMLSHVMQCGCQLQLSGLNELS